MCKDFLQAKEIVTSNPKPTKLITHFWRIDNFQHHLHMAKTGDPISLYSDQFSTGKHGYWFYLCAYPNGFLDGLGSYSSIYLHLAPGPSDTALPWPFKQSFTLGLIDQRTIDKTSLQHIKYECSPDPINSYVDGEIFKRPVKYDSSQGWGKTKFVSHEDLFAGRFIKDNSLMIAVKIEQFDLADIIEF